MKRILGHVRVNGIAYIAILVAFSSTSALAAATIGARDIKPDAVRARHIKEGHVRSTHLATGAVKTSKIGLGAVTGDRMGLGAVTTDKIGPDAVTTAKIADGSVGPSDLGVIPAARVDKPLEFGVFVPNDSESLVDLGEAIFETVPGMYDSTTSHFVAPIAGTYQVTAAFIWDPNATGVRRLTLKKNDSYVIGQADMAATAGLIQEVSGLVQLAAGDTVGAFAYQNSGAPATYPRDSRMHFDIYWVTG